MKIFLLKNKNILFFLLLFLLVLSLFQTYRLISVHFTHVDDIGVAYYIMNFDIFYKNFCENINNSNSKYNFIIYFLNINNFCEYNVVKLLYKIWIIPINWTYAPFQFYFTSFFLQFFDITDVLNVIKYGRMPSFVFMVIGLFVLYKILYVFFFNSDKFLSLLIITLLSLSLELRIYSAQMESYSISLLSNCLLIYVILSTNKFSLINIGKIILYSFIISLAISMQYQSIFLAISLFISIIIINFKNLKPIIKNFLALTFFTIVFSFLNGSFLVLKKAGAGVHWNSGSNLEYIITSNSIENRLVELFHLIVENIGYNIYIITSGIELVDNGIYFGYCVLFFSLLGFLFLLKKSKSNINYQLFLLTSFFHFFILILLIYIKALSFSPTRHILFYQPIFFIYVGYFIYSVRKFIFLSYFFYISLFLYIITSLFSWDEFSNSRKNHEIINFSTIKKSSEFANIIISDRYDLLLNFFPLVVSSKNIQYDEEILCKNFESYGTIDILWYSKRNFLNTEGLNNNIDLKNYLSREFTRCSIVNSNKSFLVKSVDIININSLTEVDLSNKTKNGANNLYLQLFKYTY